MAVITVGTNSYVTEAELATYASDRGVTIAADKTVLLIKAMDYLEAREFIGQKTDYTQALQWPRIVCEQFGYTRPNSYESNLTYNDQYCEYDSAVVPQGIKNAQMIAALLIDSGEDLQPSVGRAVKREKVDVLEVEYMDTATSTTQYRSLQDALKPFVISGIRGVRI